MLLHSTNIVDSNKSFPGRKSPVYIFALLPCSEVIHRRCGDTSEVRVLLLYSHDSHSQHDGGRTKHDDQYSENRSGGGPTSLQVTFSLAIVDILSIMSDL